MRLLDSRRLTGPSLLLDVPGAILDVALDGIEANEARAAWMAALAPLLSGVGWDSSLVTTRAHAAGLSLAISAPADALYAATEVNEAAWDFATRRIEANDVYLASPNQRARSQPLLARTPQQFAGFPRAMQCSPLSSAAWCARAPELPALRR